MNSLGRSFLDDQGACRNDPGRGVRRCAGKEMPDRMGHYEAERHAEEAPGCKPPFGTGLESKNRFRRRHRKVVPGFSGHVDRNVGRMARAGHHALRSNSSPEYRLRGFRFDRLRGE